MRMKRHTRGKREREEGREGEGEEKAGDLHTNCPFGMNLKKHFFFFFFWRAVCSCLHNVKCKDLVSKRSLRTSRFPVTLSGDILGRTIFIVILKYIFPLYSFFHKCNSFPNCMTCDDIITLTDNEIYACIFLCCLHFSKVLYLRYKYLF